MGHIAEVLPGGRDFLGQIDYQHPVPGPQLPDGVVKQIKGLFKLVIGYSLLLFHSFHQSGDERIGTLGQAAGLGHQDRSYAPGPAQVNEGLEVQAELGHEIALVHGDFLPPDLLKFIGRGSETEMKQPAQFTG